MIPAMGFCTFEEIFNKYQFTSFEVLKKVLLGNCSLFNFGCCSVFHKKPFLHPNTKADLTYTVNHQRFLLSAAYTWYRRCTRTKQKSTRLHSRTCSTVYSISSCVKHALSTKQATKEKVIFSNNRLLIS